MPLTEEQRAIRRKGVTGSEVSTLVGLNPYKAPQEVWEDKLGIAQRDPTLDDNPNIERGVYLEPALIAWTGKRLDNAVLPNSETFVSKKHELIIATPDGFGYPDYPNAYHSFQDGGIPRNRYVIEVKAPSPRTYEDWGDPEEDPTAIPAYYQPQVQWELAATDLQEARVSTLIGGNLRIYRISRSQPFIDILLRKVEAFWKYVQKQEPPPMDFTKPVEREWLKKHLRHQKDETMREYTQGEDADRMELEVLKFLQLKDIAEKAQEALEQQKAILQFSVGDAAGFLTPGHRVTWKQTKGGWKTNWKQFVGTLKKALPERAEFIDRVLTECDYSYDGSRRLLVNPRKDV